MHHFKKKRVHRVPDQSIPSDRVYDIRWWGFKLVASELLLFCHAATAPCRHRHSCILNHNCCCTRTCNLYHCCTTLANFVTPLPHLNPLSLWQCVLSPWSTTTHCQPKGATAATTSSGEAAFGSWRKTVNTLVAFKVDPLSLGPLWTTWYIPLDYKNFYING